MSYETLGIIAGILALTGYIPYIITILQGKTKPNRATWFIWTIVGGLLAGSYIVAGDGHSIWLPLGYFFGPLIVAILSLKYGYAEWTRLDTICLSAAAFSIVPWLLSDSASLTLIINVIIDSAGALPTLVKTFKEPETEDFTAWFIFLVANTTQLFAISIVTIAVIYPIYLFFLASFMVLFILRGKFMGKGKMRLSEDVV